MSYSVGTAVQALPAGATSTARAEMPLGRRAIFHPLIDFLCLGGASLILLPVAMMMPETSRPALVVIAWLFADIINHPHFAASYQIFYRGFGDKVFGTSLSRELRARYIVAGLVIPAALVAFLATGFAFGSARVLGWSANLMLFLVGWHYTKQGYGILIVDSVYRRCFFSDSEKAVFRYNAYACWFMFWLFANWYISEREMWGLAYYSFSVPLTALYGMGAVCLVTTAVTLGAFARRLLADGEGLPVAGTIAYLTTLYIWFAGRFEPAALLFVPAFHSLQYLLIVWRYEVNRSQALALNPAAGKKKAGWPLFRFAATAVLLGVAGFWAAPLMLQISIEYDHAALGSGAFLFMFWIFINLHHYFMDNVIWRRDNPETGAYLFGREPALT